MEHNTLPRSTHLGCLFFSHFSGMVVASSVRENVCVHSSTPKEWKVKGEKLWLRCDIKRWEIIVALMRYNIIKRGPRRKLIQINFVFALEFEMEMNSVGFGRFWEWIYGGACSASLEPFVNY